MPFSEMGAMSHQFRALAESQDLIGWRDFTEGYISTHFYAIQSFHLTMLSSYLNGEDWTKQFISKLLQITHSQWIYRNISLHDRRHGYLHAMNAAEIMQEIETLSNLAPKEVAKESCFLLEINFTDLSRFHIEAQKYWILAVNAARMAQDLALARGARTKRAKQKVNAKIPSRKKLGIINIKQQIRRDGMHWCITQTGTDPEHNMQPLIDRFVTKRPHPASKVATLRSNKRLRKPD